MPLSKKFKNFWVILSIVLTIFILTLCGRINSTDLPVLGTVSLRTFYDSTGKEFLFSSLKGKIWVADFIFTTCGGICPVMTRNMSKVYQNYESRSDVQFVSLSVNPEYDTPPVLAAYAKNYHADPKQWHFLTGPWEKIEEAVVQDFKIGSVENPVFHSSYFVLVDRLLRIRGYYEGTKPQEMKKISSDLKKLLNEKQ